MTREEAINNVRSFIDQLTEDCQQSIRVLVPELAESEDERTRKEIISYLESRDFDIEDGWIPWLEKQKEQKPISSFDIVPYIDDKIAELQDMWREQKVAFDWDDMHEMIEDVARHFYQKEQKPAEWSEEDIDKMVNERARKSGTTKTEMQFYRQGIKDTLKSLRPQPKQEDRYMEGYMQGLSDAEKSYNDRVAYHIDKMRDEKG